METLLEKVISKDFTIKGGSRWKYTAEHDSLVLDLKNQIFYWNSKSICGTPIDYLIKVHKYSKDEAEKLIQNLENNFSVFSFKKDIPVTYNKLIDVFWNNGKKDRSYWYNRLLTDQTIDRFRLGKFGIFYTVPILKDGNLINFQCRIETPEKRVFSWYRNVGPTLFNSDILKISPIIYITEGLIDSILLSQLGFPTVSHNAGAYGWQKKWFKEFIHQEKIYYIADSDKAGLLAALKISKILGEERTKIILFETDKEKYDTIDFFRDKHTIEEFNNLIDKSKYSYEINGKLKGEK